MGEDLKADVSAYSVCFVFFSMIMGSMIAYCQSRLYIGKYLPPYTVSVFMIGIGLSFGAENLILHGNTDTLLLSFDLIGRLDSSLIIYAFLPALLFGEAMQLNFYQAKRASGVSLLLAFPGAIAAAFLLGQFLYSCRDFFGVPFSFKLACIAGAILSATDPVSVVAALKEISKSSPSAMKLSYLITGEALLNDGAALVLFEALIDPKLSEGKSITIYIFEVCFYSPLVGIACGVAGIIGLTYLNRRVETEDSTLQLVLTLSIGYLSFFFAQYLLAVSGSIACVAAGVVLAALAPPLYLQPHAIETLWETLEWIANTLIFMLAGVIVGKALPDANGQDFLNMVVVYLAMQAIRMAMFVSLIPVLRFLSPGYTISDALFSTWAGLRGGMSLAIMLLLQSFVGTTDDMMVLESSSHTVFSQREIRNLTLTICGATTLTILINGSGAIAVYDFFYGAAKARDEGADAVIFHYVRKRVKKQSEKMLKDLRSTLATYDDEVVMQICAGVFKGKTDSKKEEGNNESKKEESTESKKSDGKADTRSSVLSDPFNSTKESNKDVQPPKTESNKRASFLYGIRRSLTGPVDEPLITKFRIVFLEVLRKCYHKHVHQGRLFRGSQAALILLNSVDIGLQTVHTEGLEDYDAVEESIKSIDRTSEIIAKMIYWLQKGGHVKTCHSFISTILLENQLILDSNKILILSSFIDAHIYAQHHISHYLGEEEGISTPEEAVLIRESAESVAKAQMLLDSMDVAIVSLHMTRQAASIILTSAEMLVQHCGEEGILSVKDTRLLFEVTSKDRRRMANLVSLPRRVAATLSPMAGGRTLAISPTQTTADRRIFNHQHKGEEETQCQLPRMTTLGSFRMLEGDSSVHKGGHI